MTSTLLTLRVSQREEELSVPRKSHAVRVAVPHSASAIVYPIALALALVMLFAPRSEAAWYGATEA